MQSISCKCWAGWITSWNKDCWEEYQQQPQICWWYHSNVESKEELKSLLMKVKKESEKTGLKLSILKTKIMASDGPITLWQMEREKVEAVTDFIFLGSKITVGGDLFSRSVVSDSLTPHELQHSRPPCPSPTPRAHSNSCLLSRWCHPPSHPLSSPSRPAFNFSQHLGLFRWVSSSNQVAKVLELQLQHQSFQWIFSTGFL